MEFFDEGDLMSVVMSCGRGKCPGTASDPFSFLQSHHPAPQSPVAEGRMEERAPMAFGGLEDLCMPFFSPPPPPPQPKPQPAPQFQLPQQHEEGVFPSSTPAFSTAGAGPTMSLREHSPYSPQQQQQTDPMEETETRSKKSKKKQIAKKVITQLRADNRYSEDNWAWRKYGQKPIKGSLYPRGYYRCSTLKECPAKKQVERSWKDPAMYILTYSGEHNHALPTHRIPVMRKSNREPSSSGLSPTTLLATSPSTEEDGEDEVDEGTLHVDDLEIAGNNELLFFHSGASNMPTASMEMAGTAYFVNIEDDPFFSHLLNGNDNNAAGGGASN